MPSPPTDSLIDQILTLRQSCDTCRQLAAQVLRASEEGHGGFLDQLEHLRTQLSGHDQLWQEWITMSGQVNSSISTSNTRERVDELVHSARKLLTILAELEQQLVVRRDKVAPQIGRLRDEARGRTEYMRAMM